MCNQECNQEMKCEELIRKSPHSQNGADNLEIKLSVQGCGAGARADIFHSNPEPEPGPRLKSHLHLQCGRGLSQR